VTEIQNALIKAGYMDGPASGQYDETTIDAMKQFQAANRLPQTGLPSATVLKKLGVSKRSNDSYAVPVNRVSESEKTRPPQ
jgi:peptidoglycan hydrolase-like protein with peptidoglycan-binding domain